MVTARGGGRRESQEAVTGWVFLLAASLSILVVAHSPHGLEDVHRLLSSSIIGNTIHDVWTFGILAGATALAIAFLHRRILLLVIDPAMAAAAGMRTAVWGMAINAWLGLAVGLSIRASGMLYTFGCLVLPALVAKSLCREVRTMFLVAPAVAVATALVGFVLAYDLDYPPAQMAVALLCLALVLAWTLRALRARWKAD
jgi:ABC-type Mn2+/Zn2+ transport system permease subunit